MVGRKVSLGVGTQSPKGCLSPERTAVEELGCGHPEWGHLVVSDGASVECNELLKEMRSDCIR